MAPESSRAYNTHTHTHTRKTNTEANTWTQTFLMTCYLDIHCQLCSTPSVCNSGSPLEVDRHTNTHTHTHMWTAPGEIPCSWVLSVSLWPLAWSIRWGKSVWGVGLNVKGKRCWKEKWKHAIDPLTPAELRVEEGEPRLCLPNTRETKISHLHFFPQDWCCLYT